ncbi:MAG: head maturation protease, ClpP-related [Pirellulales bacterium]
MTKHLQIVRASADTAELYLYDEIGFYGIDAKTFADDLGGLGDVSQIDLRINSPGGDVFDGFAIYNLLIQNPAKVTVKVDGLAASAASVVAMAGDTIEMAPSSSLMVHNAWTIAVGDADELDQAAAQLRRVSTQIANVYATRRGVPISKITEWMAAESWWSADEAVQVGMADRVVEVAVASGRGHVSAKVAEERSRLESMIAARAHARRVDREFDRLQDQRRQDRVAVAAVERRSQLRAAGLAVRS